MPLVPRSATVEQNAQMALSIASRYVMETGHVTLWGTGDELLHNDDVRRAYLGGDAPRYGPRHPTLGARGPARLLASKPPSARPRHAIRRGRAHLHRCPAGPVALGASPYVRLGPLKISPHGRDSRSSMAWIPVKLRG